MQYKNNLTGKICRAWLVDRHARRPPWVNIEFYLGNLRERDLPTTKAWLIRTHEGKLSFLNPAAFQKVFTPINPTSTIHSWNP